MKKLLNVFIVFLFGLLFFGGLGNQNEVYAATNCSAYGIVLTGNIDGRKFDTGVESNDVVFSLTNVANETYSMNFRGDLDSGGTGTHWESPSGSGGSMNIAVNDPYIFMPGKWTITLKGTGIGSTLAPWCEVATYTVEGAKCENVSVYQDRSENGEGAQCFGGNTGGCLDASHDIWIRSKVLYGSSNEPFLGTVIQDLKPGGSKQGRPNTSTGILEKNHGKLDPKSYRVIIKQDATLNRNTELCTYDFNVKINCDTTEEENRCVETEGELSDIVATTAVEKFSLCKQIPIAQQAQRDACLRCTLGVDGDGAINIENEGQEGVWTAVGCISKEPQLIVQSFIRIGLGMAGGFTLLTFLASGFIFSTSQGDPKAYGKAKEMMTSAVVGVLFIIFSVTILQFIGYEILKIPGFGG